MKTPLTWIALFTDIDSVRARHDDVELAHLYSIRTAEIDDILRVGVPEGVVVARVVSTEAHPNSDHLNVVRVDAGEGTERVIVCGAPNVRDARYVPVALPGTRLSADMVIGDTTIRGVESHGMICSLDELGLQEERAAGIWPLEENFDVATLSSALGKNVFDLRLAIPGLATGSRFGIPLAATTFEIDNKFITNRPDLFSVAGNAREFATIFDLPLTPYIERDRGTTTGYPARIESDRVLAFDLMEIRDVPARASAFDGVVHLLRLSGIATHSTHVDITNAVMTELGQPLHAFDAEKLVGTIVVRFAKDGETIDAINGKTYTLAASDLVVADDLGPVSIAGIMGGARTAVSLETRHVVYEAGCFDPVTVRRTSQRLGLRTDALTRYEKSLDPLLARTGIARVLDYLDYYGYAAAPTRGFRYLDESRVRRIAVECAHSFLETKTGVELEKSEVVRILSSLGFGVTEKDGVYSIAVPSWRATKDVDIPEDIAEEIVRIHGYERVAPRPLSGDFRPVRTNPVIETKRVARRFFSGRSWYETHTPSFTSESRDRQLGYASTEGAVRVINAYSEEASVMRRDMAGGMFEAVARNIRGRERFAFYEIGRTYRNDAGTMRQEWRIAGTAAGMSLEGFRTTLDDFMALAAGHGAASVRQGIATELATFLHPNESGTYAVDGRDVLSFGYVHPARAHAFGIPEETLYFEAPFEPLVALREKSRLAYSPIERFQAVEREINFVMDARESAGTVATFVSSFHPLIRSVAVVDVFTDAERLGADKKSVTFRLVLRSSEATITDAQALEVQNGVIGAVTAEYGIALRA